jgi:hypothetical protein
MMAKHIVVDNPSSFLKTRFYYRGDMGDIAILLAMRKITTIASTHATHSDGGVGPPFGFHEEKIAGATG